MRVTSIDKGKFVLQCKYEDRMVASSYGFTWSLKSHSWVIPATLMTYEYLKKHGIEFNSYISDEMDRMADLKVSFKKFGFKQKTEAYSHQVSLTNLVIDKKRCFFNCWMGTGKTKSVLDAISELHYQGVVNKVLVVTPASIMTNFSDEVSKHSYLDCTVIAGSIVNRESLLTSNTVIHVINYEVLDKLKNKIKSNKYDMMVFDECHRLKNRAAKCSKAALEIAKGVEYKVGMSGTLFANCTEDIFMPYKIVSPEVFGSNFTDFKNKFFIYGGFNGYEVIGYKDKESFQKLLASNSLQYTLDDVKELPPEVEMVKRFHMSPATLKTYRHLKEDCILSLGDSVKPTFNILERILRLSQLTSGFVMDHGEPKDVNNEKINLLKDTLEEVKGKVIIWCRFTHSIKRVAKLCEKLKLSYMTYYGETKDKGSYKQFNEGDTKVWIAQIQTGIGYSIPEAKYAIFYETDYSRVNHSQAKGRNRRIQGSEKGSCVYIYLQANESIDVEVFNTLKHKDFKAHEAMSMLKGGAG